MNFVFVLPLVYTVAGYFPAQPSNPCKVYLRFFAYSLVEFVILEMFLIVILPLFFDPTTSIMTQFALKFIAQSVLGLAEQVTEGEKQEDILEEHLGGTSVHRR